MRNAPPKKHGGDQCCACELVIEHGGYALPMADGDIVEDDYDGEWAGFDCCQACYDAHHRFGNAGLKIRLDALRDMSAVRSRLATMQKQVADFARFLEDTAL